MFFYLYALIELLAIFLDSGVIPTASSVYPVRKSKLAPQFVISSYSPTVVHCCLHWPDSSNLLLFANKRICRIPVR